jgi:predicted transposase/invertase (TIGR01784 family)
MTTTPHDNLVRDILAHPEHAQGELQHLLPAELSARIDWPALELVPGTYVDEALRDSYSDLLFRVPLSGRAAFLYLLLEHQSTPHALLLFRQLKYAVRFWDDWVEDHPGAAKMPVVIPLLLCHGPKGWSVATRFEDLLDIDDETRELVLDFVPKFRTLVDDLTLQTDEELQSRAMTELGRIMLWCLKTARHTDELIAGMSSWAALFRAVRSTPNGMAALALIWRYLMSVHDAVEERVLPALAAALDEEQRQDMASIADQLVEKGIKKGIEKGIEKGERGIVLRLLERRFGPLPVDTVERIERAVPGDLERWADRVLTAATLREVLEGAP